MDNEFFNTDDKDIQKKLLKESKLCDGDCGNCYFEKDMNLTCYGDNLCDRCMFNFMVEQERRERDEEHQL